MVLKPSTALHAVMVSIWVLMVDVTLAMKVAKLAMVQKIMNVPTVKKVSFWWTEYAKFLQLFVIKLVWIVMVQLNTTALNAVMTLIWSKVNVCQKIVLTGTTYLMKQILS
jgi:hypothetical protein